MNTFYLGIDVAKKSFDVALLGGEGPNSGHFSNDPDGFAKLSRWLEKREANELHACLEATGRYGDALAIHLYQQGHRVSVVNPNRIKKYAESKLQRTKTDLVDAKLIAEFCAKEEPAFWAPPRAADVKLQAMVRHVAALKDMRQQERNRLKSGQQSLEVLQVITDHVAFLEVQIADLEQQIKDHIDQHPDMKQKKELLVSIPGISDTTAAKFLAEVPDVSKFPQASQLAAHAGVTPKSRHSGSSVHSPGRMSKIGNARLRSAFYMPALSAGRYNPIIRALVERLEAKGKSKMCIIGAVMRKLIHLAYGVLKTGKPFDPNYVVNVQLSS
jgi:transposase